MSSKFSVECPVCDGSGEILEPYDMGTYAPVYDPLSGYVGYEMRNQRTGEVVRKEELGKHLVECFNCQGSGRLEWYDE